MKIATKRTPCYRFTVDLKDPKDLELLESFRLGISVENKFLKAQGQRTNYVKVQGRMGKDNPNAEKYRGYRADQRKYQCIKLPDARFGDVYVYER